MRVSEHRLVQARFSSSPHYDDRPTDEISLIVVHGISLPPGKFGGDDVEDLFLGRLDTSNPELADLIGVRVSSHLFIRRSGEIIQFVDFDKRAWHAGESLFLGRSACNDFSIGVELEGTDTIEYENVQFLLHFQQPHLLPKKTKISFGSLQVPNNLDVLLVEHNFHMDLSENMYA